MDKDPGIQPIGVGEVRSAANHWENISAFLKEELKEAAVPLQVCGGHFAGAEAVIHAMSEVFVEEETDGILMQAMLLT